MVSFCGLQILLMVIEEGKNGLFVPQGDTKALREAIQSLWEQPELTKTMGEYARKFAAERHSMEQFVDGVKAATIEVIREHVPHYQADEERSLTR